MSKDAPQGPPLEPIGPMYIADLLNHLKKVSPISREEIFAAIHGIRKYGPGLVQAEKIDEGIYRVRALVGFGLYAVIELERDRNGVLQPVIGEIVKP